MILKIGVKNGFQYLKTEGEVRVKYFKPMVVLNNILKMYEDERWDYETNSEFMRHLIEIVAEKELKDKAIKVDGKIDFTDENFWAICKYQIERLIVSHVKGRKIEDISMFHETLNELIDGLLENENCFLNNIVELHFYHSDGDISREYDMVMFNKYGSYLLNDNGQTIDVIK